MHIVTLVHGIGSSGFFASRAFLPAFTTACLLRFGPEISWLADSGVLQSVSGTPTWFTHNFTLVALGILALVELGATKSPDLRVLLNEFDGYLKGGMSLLTTLGLVGSTDAEFVQQITQQAGFAPMLTSLPVMACTVFLNTVRQKFLAIFLEADEDDSLGVQGMFAWLEDLWVVGGLIFLVLFPFVMLLLIAATFGALALLRRAAERREEQSKTACGKCNQLMYPSAVRCGNCKHPSPTSKSVGFFGQSTDRPADLAFHRFQLVAKKRCPSCATRFQDRTPMQVCGHCGEKLLLDEQFQRQYVAFISKRLPSVLAISFLCSLIPVVGLIPGVVLYRFQLVAPFRQYTPRGQAMLLRWALRIGNFILICFQWIPLAGSVVVPAMALASFLSYRGMYRRLIQTNNEQPLPMAAAMPVAVPNTSMWYLKQNGIVSGPLPKETILQMAGDRDFQPLDLVWSPEIGSWTPAISIRPAISVGGSGGK